MRNKYKYFGFTLIELIIAILVISVILLIGVPMYRNVTNNTNEKTMMYNKQIINKAIQLYITNEGIPNGSEPTEGWKQALKPYLKEWPSHPLGTSGDYVISGVYPDYKVEFIPD